MYQLQYAIHMHWQTDRNRACRDPTRYLDGCSEQHPRVSAREDVTWSLKILSWHMRRDASTLHASWPWNIFNLFWSAFGIVCACCRWACMQPWHWKQTCEAWQRDGAHRGNKWRNAAPSADVPTSCYVKLVLIPTCSRASGTNYVELDNDMSIHVCTQHA